MSTRAEFVQKAVAAGLAPDKIKLAMADRRAKVGAFDDDPVTDSAATASAPSPAAAVTPALAVATVATLPAPVQAGASGSWAPDAPKPGIIDRIKEGARYLMPARMEYSDNHRGGIEGQVLGQGEQGLGENMLGTLGADAKDLFSLPRRAFGGASKLVQGDLAGAKREMQKTKGDNVLEDINRELPMALIPGMQSRAGAGIVGRIGAGMVNATPSAAIHQLETVSQTGKLDSKAAAAEVATGGLFGLAGGLVSRIKSAAVPAIKRGISKMSEVGKEALDAVSAPVGGQQNLQRFGEAAKKYGTAEGGTNLMPMAEELAKKVGDENVQRIGRVETSRTAQKAGMEASLLKSREEIAGGPKVGRIRDISSGDRGEAIKLTIEGAKPNMQKAYTEGDKAAYGGLRTAPALTEKVTRLETSNDLQLVPDGQGGHTQEMVPATRKIVEDVPVLPGRIDEVLSEFKALSPDQGVAKITPAAAKAIKAMGALANQAKTIDDLVDLKWQVRHLQSSGGYEGALFDATRDDVALAKVMEKIHEVERESIKAAAPKRAAKIIDLVDKNNQLYGSTLEVLKKGDLKFRATQNTENIISKVKGMGPDEARALMSEAQTNKVLQPYVKELQRGFEDDLLRSSLKGDEFHPQQLATEWANISDDIKEAWLHPDTIKRINDAVKKGTREIKDPELVGKALFGNQIDVFMGERKLGNIVSGAQKKALAELDYLSKLFGKDYTEDAISAYRAKQLQLGETGELPGVNKIRTGKFGAAMTAGASTGASAGAAVAGPVGAMIGGPLGAGAGLYLQSPAGAVLMFKALNRLEQASPTRNAVKKIGTQAIKTAAFGPKEEKKP